MTGGSTLICFDLKGGKKAAFDFQNALEIVRISNNLGDAKSLITHPATTTHKNLTDEARAELGIGPGTLRISVGLEDADDLIEDIDMALKAAVRREPSISGTSLPPARSATTPCRRSARQRRRRFPETTSARGRGRQTPRWFRWPRQARW